MPYDLLLKGGEVIDPGWPFQQHSLSPAEDKLTIDTFEAVNRTTPIANLRWSIAHAPRIDAPTIARFKAIGAGIAILAENIRA